MSGIALASWRAGLGLATSYDEDLREKRLEAYEGLWVSLKGLDLRAQPTSMSVGEARALRDTLTGWYHSKGGLLMSRATQRKFAALQRTLVRVTPAAARDATGLEAAVLHKLINSASALRTSTTHDVLSRRGPLLAPKRWGA